MRAIARAAVAAEGCHFKFAYFAAVLKVTYLRRGTKCAAQRRGVVAGNLEETVFWILVHVRNACDFFRLQAYVVVCAKFAANFLAQKGTHGFAGNAADDFAEDVADVDGIVGAFCARRPSRRLLFEGADMHLPVEP